MCRAIRLGGRCVLVDLEDLGAQIVFVELGAAQCGYCTPGILLSARSLLETNANPSRDEIREALAGNLCRCTGYEKILDAVRLAAAVKGGGRG